MILDERSRGVRVRDFVLKHLEEEELALATSLSSLSMVLKISSTKIHKKLGAQKLRLAVIMFYASHPNTEIQHHSAGVANGFRIGDELQTTPPES